MESEIVEPDRTITIVSIIGLIVIWEVFSIINLSRVGKDLQMKNKKMGNLIGIVYGY